MKLSILICTLEDRKESLNRLLSLLESQLTDQIEVLIESDSGQCSTGSKRNKLLERSIGEYVAFVDDDDLVSEQYVSLILDAIKTKPDCVGITVIKNRKGIKTKIFKSLNVLDRGYYWAYNNIGVYFPPDHLTPVKREHAINTKFKDISKGEDTYYSIKMLHRLNTEVIIKEPIYFYDYKERTKEYYNKVNPLVSAMMLTHKRFDFFQRAYQCFVDQSYTNTELVVVCNGDDQYKSKIKEFLKGKENVIYVSADQKCVVGELRNLALDNANGDYIIGWDDDDVYHSTRIEQQMVFIKANMCSCTMIADYYCVYNGKKYILHWVHGARQSILFKKTNLRYKHIPVGEDDEFFERLKEHYDFGLVRQNPKLYTYYYHGGNITDQKKFDGFCLERFEIK